MSKMDVLGYSYRVARAHGGKAQDLREVQSFEAEVIFDKAKRATNGTVSAAKDRQWDRACNEHVSDMRDTKLVRRRPVVAKWWDGSIGCWRTDVKPVAMDDLVALKEHFNGKRN